MIDRSLISMLHVMVTKTRQRAVDDRATVHASFRFKRQVSHLASYKYVLVGLNYLLLYCPIKLTQCFSLSISAIKFMHAYGLSTRQNQLDSMNCGLRFMLLRDRRWFVLITAVTRTRMPKIQVNTIYVCTDLTLVIHVSSYMHNSVSDSVLDSQAGYY